MLTSSCKLVTGARMEARSLSTRDSRLSAARIRCCKAFGSYADEGTVLFEMGGYTDQGQCAFKMDLSFGISSTHTL
eukprot:771673-Pyramimonas_sp.AAC.1